jgi:hypothetical protein
MKLKIRSVAEKGVYAKERLILKALANTNVGDFMLLRTGFHDGQVTVGVREAYWFPYKEIEKGDLVVVYTKDGKQSEKQLESGSKSHFFYWGLDKAIWNASDVAPVILYAPEWESKTPDELYPSPAPGLPTAFGFRQPVRAPLGRINHSFME